MLRVNCAFRDQNEQEMSNPEVSHTTQTRSAAVDRVTVLPESMEKVKKDLSRKKQADNQKVTEEAHGQLLGSIETSRPRLGNESLIAPSPLSGRHLLSQEIARVCQVHWDNWGTPTDGMELLESDGTLRIYRRRLDQHDGVNKGIALDPVLAIHTVTGVSAREVAEMFWNLQYRLDWEHTLDSAPIVLDTLASDTLLLHQIYKRLWPTAQRDSVFWSSIRHAEQRTMVVNCSTEVGAPPLASGRQRMQLNVSLICETEMPEGRLPTERSQLRCRLQYSATVHPGGWAPMAVLRQVAKREYPKFLRRFTAYCIDRVKHMPVQL